MVAALINGLAVAIGVLLYLALFWGVPSYFIWREDHVPVRERKVWIAATVLFSWIAFVAFVFAAPVTTALSRERNNFVSSKCFRSIMCNAA